MTISATPRLYTFITGYQPLKGEAWRQTSCGKQISKNWPGFDLHMWGLSTEDSARHKAQSSGQGPEQWSEPRAVVRAVGVLGNYNG